MRTSAPPLLAIFRSQLQGDLLSRVLLNPGRLSVSDLARALAAPNATVAREVDRLEKAGLLSTTRLGRARLVGVNEENPAVLPLRQLVLITFGPRAVVAEEFAGLPGINKLLIFGSWAARYTGEPGPPPADVDVLLVGNPDRDDVYDAAERAQNRLGRDVNAVVVSPARWDAAEEPFVREVQRRPVVLLEVAQAQG